MTILGVAVMEVCVCVLNVVCGVYVCMYVYYRGVVMLCKDE